MRKQETKLDLIADLKRQLLLTLNEIAKNADEIIQGKDMGVTVTINIGVDALVSYSVLHHRVAENLLEKIREEQEEKEKIRLKLKDFDIIDEQPKKHN